MGCDGPFGWGLRNLTRLGDGWGVPQRSGTNPGVGVGRGIRRRLPRPLSPLLGDTAMGRLNWEVVTDCHILCLLELVSFNHSFDVSKKLNQYLLLTTSIPRAFKV